MSAQKDTQTGNAQEPCKRWEQDKCETFILLYVAWQQSLFFCDKFLSQQHFGASLVNIYTLTLLIHVDSKPWHYCRKLSLSKVCHTAFWGLSYITLYWAYRPCTARLYCFLDEWLINYINIIYRSLFFFLLFSQRTNYYKNVSSTPQLY